MSLRVCACGAVTAIGLAAAPTFAALRAGITAFRTTCYRTSYGEPIIGAPILGVDASSFGQAYLAALAGPALDECLARVTRAERGRIGVLAAVGDSIDETDARGLLLDLARSRGLVATGCVDVLPGGDLSVIHGIRRAEEWIANGLVDVCLVGGVDTYLSRSALADLERRGRLKTSRNSDALIPGEAACFVALANHRAVAAGRNEDDLVVLGIAMSSGDPVVEGRGAGLARAIREALAGADVASRQVDFRPTNQSGESALALESGIAAMRVFNDPGPYPPAWVPAESIGAVGAAVGSLLLGWTAAGIAKGYAPGAVALLEFVSAEGPQGAIVAARLA